MSGLLEFNPGEIWTSIIIATAVIIGLWEGAKKLLELFNAYHKKKNENEDIQELLKQCVENDKHMVERIDLLSNISGALTEIVKRQIRHSIVRIAEEALKSGSIGAYELQSLEELYEIYCGDILHGNSYVHSLMDRVRDLDIDYSNGNPKDYIHEESDED